MFKKKPSLTTMIFIAMILGAILGITVGAPMKQIGFIGDIWLNCIKMMVVPMVFTTITAGIAAQKDAKSIGRIGVRITLYYIFTTLMACAVGLIVANILKPGVGLSLMGMESQSVDLAMSDFSVSSFFMSLFSDNIFKTFTEGNIIQTLVISAFFGIAILKMQNEAHKDVVVRAFESFNSLIFDIIGIVMKLSPIGVFCLMASSFGEYGINVFKSIAGLVGTYYAACFAQIFIVYGGLLWIGTGINPIKFIKDTAELWIYTISTCSSVAAIPVSLKIAKEKFNIPEKISGFTISMGAQLGNDGSVLMYGCVFAFIAQNVGLELSIPMMVRAILIASILSIGGNGIPGSNIVKLVVVVEALGLPTELVGIIAAFYRLFNMGSATNNSLGDLVGTIFVGKLEEKRLKKLG
jgi:Na+/H+-dicarboxylate symporter